MVYNSGMAQSTDTDRLNWLLEKLLTRKFTHGADLFAATGIEDDELRCEGHISLGERMRTIIDERLEQEKTESG